MNIKEIRLKKVMDKKGILLKDLSNETLIPYSTLKEWYETANFIPDKLSIHQLKNIAIALDVELNELVTLTSS